MQVVVRALHVLSAIGESRAQGVSLTEISARLGLPPPSAHRLLKVLILEGFVHRDPNTLLHFPGDKLLRLMGPPRSTTVAETARRHVRRLSVAFNETAFVAELLGPRAVCVALAESQRPLRLSVRIGHDLPLHAAASARVLLAYLAVEEARTLLELQNLEKFTADTPGTVAEVMRHLEGIRERGFDICESELDTNVWAVSVPIRRDGEVLASLTLTAPLEHSADAQLRERMVAGVHAAVQDIEREM
jgi:DNA-binding IclR family transcriptional regulator